MAGGVPAEKIAVVYDGVPLLEPVRKVRSDRGAEGRRSAGARYSQISQHLEADLRDAAMLVYLTKQRRPGVGRAAGDVGGRAGDREPRGRIAGNRAASRDRAAGGEYGGIEIAAAIRELTEDRALARTVGRGGTARSDRTVHRDHMVRRTMEVYKQALFHD